MRAEIKEIILFLKVIKIGEKEEERGAANAPTEDRDVI